MSIELEFLQMVLLKAGDVLSELFEQRDVSVTDKDDDSLVTAADLASEKTILSMINEKYPEDKVFSEEAGLSSADRTPGSKIWIIDPLDGTTNFANKYPFFCISIARGTFLESGLIQVDLGGVHDPMRNECFMAQLGKGVTKNGHPISVRPNRTPEMAFLVTGFSYHKGEQLEKDIQRFLSVAERCQSIRRDGAAALDLAYVAAGIYDAYWEFGLKPWDVAAGSLLVAEAGGVVCDPHDSRKAFDPEMPGILCGSKSITDYLLSKMD